MIAQQSVAESALKLKVAPHERPPHERPPRSTLTFSLAASPPFFPYLRFYFGQRSVMSE